MDDTEIIIERKEGEAKDLYTKEEVNEFVRRRVQRTHNAFFARYGVADLNGLDVLVQDGYTYRRSKNEKLNPVEKETSNESIALEDLIGLDNIKRKINRLAALNIKNKDLGIKQSMNYVFLGNPGTGKTVTARALAKVFFDNGIIKKNSLVEVDRTELVGEYIGQTAPKAKKVFESALGGVLFIDEAYLLAVDKQSSTDYCHEVLMVLNKLMEDYRGQLVVILAGYKDETLAMLKGNRGLKSRINAYFDFDNYTNEELESILQLIAKTYQYGMEESVFSKIIEIAKSRQNSKDYSNARELRNIFEGVIEFQAYRTKTNPKDRNITMEDLLEWQIENDVVLDSDLSEA